MRYSFRSVSVLSLQSRAIPSTPEADKTVGLAGTTPSIDSVLLPARDVGLPGFGRVTSAGFPARSVVLPLDSTNEFASLMSSGLMKSPLSTMYLNRNVEVALPETYVARTSRVPALSVKVGDPLTMTASEKATSTKISLPAM